MVKWADLYPRPAAPPLPEPEDGQQSNIAAGEELLGNAVRNPVTGWFEGLPSPKHSFSRR